MYGRPSRPWRGRATSQARARCAYACAAQADDGSARILRMLQEQVALLSGQKAQLIHKVRLLLLALRLWSRPPPPTYSRGVLAACLLRPLRIQRASRCRALRRAATCCCSLFVNFEQVGELEASQHLLENKYNHAMDLVAIERKKHTDLLLHQVRGRERRQRSPRPAPPPLAVGRRATRCGGRSACGGGSVLKKRRSLVHAFVRVAWRRPQDNLSGDLRAHLAAESARADQGEAAGEGLRLQLRQLTDKHQLLTTQVRARSATERRSGARGALLAPPRRERGELVRCRPR